jgi:excisionase family DNA binding protein
MDTNFETVVRELVHESVKDEVKNIIESQKEILTIEDAAALLGLSKSYIYKMTAKGYIPFYRPLGKVMYFERSVLLDWVRAHPAQSKEKFAVAAAQYVDRNPLTV